MINEYRTEILNRKSGSFINSTEVYSVVYIVRGEVGVEINAQFRKFIKGEFFFLNPGEVATLHWPENGLASRLLIEPAYLFEKNVVDHIYFSVDGKLTNSKELNHTAELIKNFLLFQSDVKEKGGYSELGAYYTLMADLIRNYGVDDALSQVDKDDYGSKMIRFLHMNYRNHISLNEIADKLHISAPTASRIFYEKAGVNFGDYLRELRLEQAKNALATTDESITSIALNSGFGSSSAMNKVFLKYYEITPGEYRKKNKTEVKVEKAQNDEVLKALSESDNGEVSDTRELTVDISEKLQLGENEFIGEVQHSQILNVGSVNSLRAAQMQKQVASITESLGIKYIRLWGLFTQDMHLLTEKSNVYNFSFLDEVLDYIVDHGLNLFIDLGLRGDGTRANEDRMINEKNNCLVFNSKDKWLHILGAFLDHIRYRYDKVVNNWIVEISFFLNNVPYYEGKGYSSNEVWDETVGLIRRKIPGMKIAGPGMPLVSDTELMKMWVEHLMKAGQQPDYFTCISFPYNDSLREAGKTIESYGIISDREFHRSLNISDIEIRIKSLLDILKKNGYAGGCVLTDWNYSISNRNYLQDSTYRAAFTAQCMIHNLENIDMFGVFYASDLLSAFSDTKTVLQGSAGIVSRDGIEKPVFHVFKFMTQLGRHIFLKTEHCLISGDSEGREIRILMFNCQPPEADYYLLAEDAFQPAEVDHMFSRKAEKFHITLKNSWFTDRVQIHQNILNEDHGSVLHHWIQMGCSRSLSREDLQYLRNVSIPETVINETVVKNSKLELDFELEANEVRFVKIISFYDN